MLIYEDNRILAGHGRVSAAQELGLVEVPCLRISHLKPAEKRAYVLADHKLALNAGWDQKLLTEELKGLIAEDIKLDLSVTGFTGPGGCQGPATRSGRVHHVAGDHRKGTQGGPQEWMDAAMDYKLKWEKELERRKKLGLKLPDPVPHPNDIVIDMKNGTVRMEGPMTKDDKAILDLAKQLADAEGKDLLDFLYELRAERAEAGGAGDEQTEGD